MKNWKTLIILAATLAAILTSRVAHAQSPQPPPNSAKSSPTSDTRANKTTDAAGNASALACNADSSGLTATNPGNAGALACNAGSSGMTAPDFSQGDQSSTSSASEKRTLAGEGACVPGKSSASKKQTLAVEGACVPGNVLASCAAAVEELKASRILIDALEIENASLKTRLETEKQMTATLTEVNETRRSESDALRNAIAAKNETIAAKDAVITSQDKLVEALKKKKPSPWRRIGDILIGAAAIAVLK
ncbi:MAG: hypothetical protein ABL999_06830 [Pyrinomonadaceae bacterium]